MSEATERWLEQARAWLDAELAEIEAKDDAAYARFRAALLPFD
jgi:hypothetical protein